MSINAQCTQPTEHPDRCHTNQVVIKLLPKVFILESFSSLSQAAQPNHTSASLYRPCPPRIKLHKALWTVKDLQIDQAEGNQSSITCNPHHSSSSPSKDPLPVSAWGSLNGAVPAMWFIASWHLSKGLEMFNLSCPIRASAALEIQFLQAWALAQLVSALQAFK